MHRSKKYKNARKLVEKSKVYTLDEALDLLPKVSTSKFDSSIELHINLNLSEKQKKISIKGSATLPHQVGPKVKIAVLTSSDHFGEAQDADTVGSDDLIKKIQDGWTDFDVLLATPDIMPKIAVLGKILGPKGKMPNPKNNTVTTDIKDTIESYKKGKTDFKADAQGGIHQVVGKISLKKDQLLENIQTFLKAVFNEVKNLQANPFKTIYLSPTMGPSIRLDVNVMLKDLT
ncbi:50S ribosomal protein L1 [Candidatus Dojkabacteria bacterium]|nr:50S ribosomal protein L1 [Candidatus Dojkabacteria bacterium]